MTQSTAKLKELTMIKTTTFSALLVGLTALTSPALADSREIALKRSILETVRADVQVLKEGRNAAAAGVRAETGFDRERSRRPLQSLRIQN
jgi:hypothetical protein